MVLKYLRKKTRPILIGTLLLIIPAFVFLYGWSKIADRGAIPQVIAKVGKAPITWKEYQIELQEYMSYFGKSYSADTEKRIKNQVLQSLIQRCLLTEEAKKRKINISDDEVVLQMREFFKDKTGKFDSKLFLLINNRDPERINLLEEDVRMQIMLEKLRSEITASVKVSEDEAYEYFLTSEAEAKIKYILLNPEHLKKNIEVNENELIGYYEQNKESFKDGPWRKIEYILVNKEQAAEDEINADEQKERMLKDKAFQISLKLLDANDWKSFAEKEGLLYGITGYFSQDEPIEDFNESLAVNQAVFSVAYNEVSEPLRIEKGYVIFRRPSGAEPQYNEIADKIRQIVEDQKTRDLANRIAEEILSELQKDKIAEEIAKNYSLEIKESGYFSRQGFIADIGYAPEIAQTVFSGAQNNWTKVNTLAGDILIFKTIDIREPSKEKFQDEKDNITVSLLQKKKQEFFMDWVKDLTEKNKNRIVILWDELREN